MDIKYVGTRTEHGCEVVKEVDGVLAGPLDLRLDLWKHSAEFEWSYGGSGPAQLALALLADATGQDRLAVSLHQDFKFRFVGHLPREGFEMTAEEIEKWAADAAAKLDLSDWEAEDGG
jgi:hypothetical protein